MSRRTSYWILLTNVHITDTYIPPEGNVWNYDIARNNEIKRGDVVYFWWHPDGHLYGWGEVIETPRDVVAEVPAPDGMRTAKRTSVVVLRVKGFDPPITEEMMRNDSNLRQFIPAGFDDLYAVPIRPGQAHYLNDYVREHGLESPAGSRTVGVAIEEPEPKLTIKTLLRVKETTDEGRLIEAVTIPWFDIIEILTKDPRAAFEFTPDQWEEIIAGAYQQSGFDTVILTPRSGDYGRDVIAIKKGLGEVRIIDQVKAFKPDHLVTANDVRALAGVLQTDGASKGFLTTTSDFAPRIRTDPLIAPLIPQRLGLIDGHSLIRRLIELRRK